MTIRSADDDWIIHAAAFVAIVWSPHPKGAFVFVAARHAGGGPWRDQAFELSASGELKEWLAAHPRERYDIYACPNPFSCPYRRREFALRSPLAWSDLDDGDAGKFRPRPNLVWKTSPGRKQAVWIWDRSLSVERAEAASRELTRMAGGDINGWSVTKYLRVPYTYNHKPKYDRPLVMILHADWTPQPFDRALIRDATTRRHTRGGLQVQSKLRPLPDFSITFEKFRFTMHPMVRALVRDRTPWQANRSKRVFQIVVDLHRVGASFEEIATILKRNIYFLEKYGNSDDALAREISRILDKLGDEK